MTEPQHDPDHRSNSQPTRTKESLDGSKSGSRAVQYRRYGGPEVLEVVRRADPKPGPGEVRLAVRAASINPFDAKLRSGMMAAADAPPAPVIPGTDVAGVVEAVGAGVDSFAVGDEVLGRASGGAYAEKALAQAADLVAKPAGLSWEDAASLEVIVHTAHAVLQDVAVGPGQILLVHGASGAIGTIVVQLATARGVHVIGSASPHHQETVEALGAVPVVYGPGLPNRVQAAASSLQRNRPIQPSATVDAVIDLAGKGPLTDLINLVGDPGRVVTVAHPDAEQHGVRFSYRRPTPGALAAAAASAADGNLILPTVTTYPLHLAAQAQQDNSTGQISGKLVLLPEQSTQA